MRSRIFRNRLSAVLSSAILLVTGGALAPGAAVGVEPTLDAPLTAAPAIDTWYRITSVHSGKAIDIEGAAPGPGAMALQWTPHDGHHQQFRFAPAGDGHYRILARHSGHALDVYEWNPDNGAEIRQWTDLNGYNQQWRLIERGGGEVSIINRFSDKALEVWEFATNDGARITQYDSHGGANQRWRLVPVDGGGTPPGSGDCGAGTPNAEVTGSAGSWTARNGGNTVYSGGDLMQAMRAAVASLTPGRGTQERVVVRGSGTVAANQSLDLPSNTRFESCGTINVTGTPSGDNAVVRIRNASNVSVSYLTVTGGPWFGVFVRNGSNLHFGQIDLRLSTGLGVRIDNHSDRNQRVRDVSIDHVYVSGTNNHGVETYGVDGLTIGTVIARNTGYSGLLLNDTINATVGLVDGQGAGTGTGYAAFRMANRNGRIGNNYPMNVHVGEVIARGGGRGVFCVSESGGVTIDRVDIANVGSNAILIENCYNVRIGAVGGTVTGTDIRIAARSEFPNTRDVLIENLTLTNSALTESPCGVNVVFRNLNLVNSPRNTCS